jgi:hypothetical protein
MSVHRWHTGSRIVVRKSVLVFGEIYRHGLLLEEHAIKSLVFLVIQEPRVPFSGLMQHGQSVLQLL